MTSITKFEPGFQKTVRWTLFTEGAVIILMGALGALNPLLGSPSPPTTMGLGLTVIGLNFLVPYISLKQSTIRPKWFLLICIVNMAFGVLFITHLGLVLFKFPVLAGVWMVFAACSRAFMAFENFRAGIRKWWITFTVAGYMVFAAAAMMANTADTVSIPSWSAMIVMGMFVLNEARKIFAE